MIVFCFMGLIGSEVSVLQGRSSVPPPSLWSVRIVFYRKVVGAKSPIIDNGLLGAGNDRVGLVFVRVFHPWAE